MSELHNINDHMVLAASFVSLALALLMGMFIAKQVLVPLKAISFGAEMLGKGVLDYRINISTGDELQKLSEDFNRMAEKLADVQNSMELRIAERTAELTESNKALEQVISAREMVERELRAEKNLLETITEAMQDGLTVQDREFNIIYQNKTIKSIFGDTCGEKCYRIYEGEDSICAGCPVEKSFRDGLPHTDVRKITSSSGDEDYWENTANPIKNEDGEINSCLEITRNITRQKKTEEQLRKMRDELEVRVRERTAELTVIKEQLEKDIEIREKTQQVLIEREKELEELSRRLITSQENERSRIALELHDELGQQLAAMQLVIGRTLQEIEPDNRYIELLSDKIDKATQELRRICKGLRPMTLDTLGLNTALHILVEEFRESSGVNVEAELNEVDEGSVSPETAIIIFRVLQEGLNNILRHANAQHVHVSLMTEDSSVALKVRDDGMGFINGDLDKEKGIGIDGMKERVMLSGGTLEVESEPGNGTSIKMRVRI